MSQAAAHEGTRRVDETHFDGGFSTKMIATAFRLQRTEDEHRVTTFELFFDLVYVFSFTQITAWIAHEHDAVGTVEGLVLLGLLWWTWCGYAWLTNRLVADRGPTWVGMVVAMVAVFTLGLGARDVWSTDAAGFAAITVVAAYALVRGIHAALFIASASAEPQLRHQLTTSIWTAAASTGLLLAGAFVDPTLRLLLWLAALAVDVITTWWFASRRSAWRIEAPSHFSERFSLIVIVALGESVVAIGVGAQGVHLDASLMVWATLGVLLAVAFWWCYFRRIAEPLAQRLAESEPAWRARVAVNGYTYLHFPVVAGIVIAAAGVEELTVNIADGNHSDHVALRLLMIGVAVFLASVAALRVVTGRSPLAPLVAAAAVGLLVFAAEFSSSPIAELAGVVAIVAAVGAIARP